MRRSKLEMYIDILGVLAQEGPLKLTHVMNKTNINCSVLNECFYFLIKQSYVEERIVKKGRPVYTVAQKGITVLRYFQELKQAFPIIEEAQKTMPIPV